MGRARRRASQVARRDRGRQGSFSRGIPAATGEARPGVQARLEVGAEKVGREVAYKVKHPPHAGLGQPPATCMSERRTRAVAWRLGQHWEPPETLRTKKRFGSCVRSNAVIPVSEDLALAVKYRGDFTPARRPLDGLGSKHRA